MFSLKMKEEETFLYPCAGSLLYNLVMQKKSKRSSLKSHGRRRKTKEGENSNSCSDLKFSLDRQFFEKPVVYFNFDIHDNHGFQTITYLSDDEAI